MAIETRRPWAVCRTTLMALVGLYEEDAIEEAFGSPECQRDCDGCNLPWKAQPARTE